MATRTNSPPKPHLGFGTRIRKSPFFESKRCSRGAKSGSIGIAR